MRPGVLAASISGLLLLAGGLGVWLWWPPRPEEPRFRPLDLGEVRLWSRPGEVDIRGQELLVPVPRTVIWLESSDPLGPVLFQVRGRPGTVVVSSRGSERAYRPPLSGTGADLRPDLFLEWQPGEPRRYGSRPDAGFYRLALSFPDRTAAGSESGEAPRLAFLGTRERLDRDYYGVEWRGCGVPESVRAGEEVPVLARARNTSPHTWPHEGNARVRLAGRWLRDDGTGSELLTDLEAPVEPGSELVGWLRPRAPDRPGRHTLELDLEFEPLASFSEKGAPTCRAEVAVE